VLERFNELGAHFRRLLDGFGLQVMYNGPAYSTTTR
jgi:hypothetical protein